MQTQNKLLSVCLSKKACLSASPFQPRFGLIIRWWKESKRKRAKTPFSGSSCTRTVATNLTERLMHCTKRIDGEQRRVVVVVVISNDRLRCIEQFLLRRTAQTTCRIYYVCVDAVQHIGVRLHSMVHWGFTAFRWSDAYENAYEAGRGKGGGGGRKAKWTNRYH